ncbi:uncharacterized protein MELLADRAFT_86647 [Melampsora larici-populina 98AG31]|uniref:Uncharacterized protein n=1 Tax=Melampsora larici-populina (strain 98AG31 / pathotype 3-4-7) TaxID=747676 RepID=F4RMI8_MELLP|nr:uncharacterized protein MELLADRAFT_86647 [Melampsora larici-populina 98AG31]EGG06432.1 hypothetical protein MELLADRAFT_86647 [Melampsora larici-populina 98AG31]
MQFFSCTSSLSPSKKMLLNRDFCIFPQNCKGQDPAMADAQISGTWHRGFHRHNLQYAMLEGYANSNPTLVSPTTKAMTWP